MNKIFSLIALLGTLGDRKQDKDQIAYAKKIIFFFSNILFLFKKFLQKILNLFWRSSNILQNTVF